jgi:hypothetical protein
MTIDASPTLTAEELNSFVDLAMLTPSPRNPGTAPDPIDGAWLCPDDRDGPQVTGDGLIRITEEASTKSDSA